MSQIRKRSIKAIIWIYTGFVLGAVNTYFLTHKNWFQPDEYGLTQSLIQVGLLVAAFSTLGVSSYLYKFFPYYEDNLPNKNNDILSIALLVSVAGFILTCIGVFFLEPLILQKFSRNSAQLVEYFYWTLPFGFFIMLFVVLESYSYGFHKGLIASVLKETVLRFYSMIIILLKVFNVISFHSFIILFCCQYAIITTILAVYLHREGKLWISFKVSKVTQKFRKKILAILLLTYMVTIVGTLRVSIDALVLAARINLDAVGIFGFAAYMVALMHAPFRSMLAITIPILSRAWKEKNHKEISRIYSRSSINLLCFSLLVFFCIWLNYEQAIRFFNINPEYLGAKWVFFLLGVTAIIETGTGVNAQIIGTSTYWRFELWTSLLLTALIIPLSYYLTVEYGLIGPAVANLISFSIYNTIRFWFLWKKFNLQPFTFKTLEILVGAVVIYMVVNSLFGNLEGLLGLILRTSLFTGGIVLFIYTRNISPDLKPVLNNLLFKILPTPKE
ncbi:MAG: lipopolysaccharide biosynthesis protein [Ferruginibacter sp.]